MPKAALSVLCGQSEDDTVLILCKTRGYCYYAHMKTILFYYLAEPFPPELKCSADYLNSVAVMHILIVCLVSESQSSDYNTFNVISPISVSQGSRYSDVLCVAITRITTATLTVW